MSKRSARTKGTSGRTQNPLRPDGAGDAVPDARGRVRVCPVHGARKGGCAWGDAPFDEWDDDCPPTLEDIIERHGLAGEFERLLGLHLNDRQARGAFRRRASQLPWFNSLRQLVDDFEREHGRTPGLYGALANLLAIALPSRDDGGDALELFDVIELFASGRRRS